MKLIKGIVCPPGVESVELFTSDLPDGSILCNVVGRMPAGEVFSFAMYDTKEEAISKWNSMFSKAVKS